MTADDDPLGLSESDPAHLAPGTLLGPFRIGRMLGKGGMAAVYEAREAPPLERVVALKVLPREFLHDDTFSRRFVHEARTIASLEHSNIVPVYASGIDGGIPWISMRLIAGGSLSTLLQRGPLSLDRTRRILTELANALDFAHARGVIHRDVKPSNILLDTSGRAYLCDFGLARLVMDSDRWTRSGTLIGTPHYMAPEQAISGRVDERCDTYSLGIVAYEMLTGTLPFQGDTPLAVLMQHANARVPTLRSNDCPEAVSLAIQKALAKNPADRWPSARAFVEAFGTGVAQSALSKRLRVAAATAAVLTIASAGAFWFRVEAPAREFNEGHLVTGGSPPPPVEPEGDRGNSGKQPPEGDKKPLTGDETPVNPSSQGGLLDKVPDEVRNVVLGEPVTAGHAEPTPPMVTPPGNPQPAPAPAITKPILRCAVTPDYPPFLLTRKIAGRVTLKGTVKPDGHVTDVSVDFSNQPRMQEAAIKAFLRFQYDPAWRGDVPVPHAVSHTFELARAGAKSADPPDPRCD